MARLPEYVSLLAVMLACDAGPSVATPMPAPAPMLGQAAGQADNPRKAGKVRREKLGKAGKGQKGKDKPAPTQAAHSKAAKTAAQPSTGPGGAALPACPASSALSYRSFGDGFLRTWCTGCHSSTLAAADRQDAPEDVNFDKPALYKPHARAVYERAVLEAHAAADVSKSASPMPPAGVVPEADRRRLAEWIACGSPGT